MTMEFPSCRADLFPQAVTTSQAAFEPLVRLLDMARLAETALEQVTTTPRAPTTEIDFPNRTVRFHGPNPR